MAEQPRHNHRKKRRRRSFANARNVLIRYGYEFPQSFKLGSGRYSKVYKIFHSVARCNYAVKITDLKNVSESFREKFVPRERRIWRELDHPNTVRLYKDFKKHGYLFEIIDLANCDMLDHLRNHGPIDELTCRGWVLQLIDGLTYLHNNRIVHRDLKLENILIFEDDVIKITDYGFSKKCLEEDELSSTFCGTKIYKAPEVLQSIEYDPFKADIWSFGVVCFVMLTDKFPFHGRANSSQIVNEQRDHRYEFPSRLGISAECRETIDILLTFDPSDRPSIFDVRSLQWFASDDPTTN